MSMPAPVAKPGGAVIPISLDDPVTWLRFGQDRGWVSSLECDTHSCVPMTDEEEAAFEEGGDPCIFVVRIWP